MNIFQNYRELLIKLIKDLNKNNLLKIPDDLNSINVDIPPSNFGSDISSNVAMVLSKLNQKPPIEVANIIIKKLHKDQNIEKARELKTGGELLCLVW